MVKNIRPHKLFMLVNSKSYYERMISVILPEMRTPVLLETAVLVALTKIVKAKSFFEFGTFPGMQTLNIAANLLLNSKVYTLDFNKSSFEQAIQDEHDIPISNEHFEFKDKLASWEAHTKKVS